jgi:hypothetical protein
MLEARVKQLEKQAHEDFRYNESLMTRLIPFLRKEVVEKQVTETKVAKKEDDDDEEDRHNIAFVLLHCFDMIHCHIALIYYIVFVLLLCFDMLHCHIAFVLLHFFDM